MQKILLKELFHKNLLFHLKYILYTVTFYTVKVITTCVTSKDNLCTIEKLFIMTLKMKNQNAHIDRANKYTFFVKNKISSGVHTLMICCVKLLAFSIARELLMVKLVLTWSSHSVAFSTRSFHSA